MHQLRYALRNAGIETGCAIELADREAGELFLAAAKAGVKLFHQAKAEDLEPRALIDRADRWEVRIGGVPVRWPW